MRQRSRVQVLLFPAAVALSMLGAVGDALGQGGGGEEVVVVVAVGAGTQTPLIRF
jgi:hypothetical protein